ncbi:MAG: peptide ligase PGM1-related protein [Actinomycetota bacterium]
MVSFAQLQSQLAAALASNTPGSSVPHVLVALPSLSVGESLLSHYAERIPALEHRYLLSHLMLPRIESCEIVFVSCQAASREVLDYYLSLVPADRRDSMKARFRLLEVPDRTARSVAAKLLDRPDLIAELRASFRGRPAFIEPWNVTTYEVELARLLGVPINGTSPDLWPIGYKSAGRRLFAEANVPMPYGREGVRSIDDVVVAVAEIRSRCPAASGVVVKTDDSGAGDGNQVIRFDEATTSAEVRAIVGAFPAWYLTDLAAGGVVEELVAGAAFASPSAQVDILPDGEPVVLATHEQVLGGPTGQVYTGCRFPADSVYTAHLGQHARAVGQILGRRGALGRFSVDFAAARRATGRWDVFALEINLRKGGTTHPYSALRNLAPGHYDVESGQWITVDGSSRCYESTDNLIHPKWRGRPPSNVIRIVADAGLQFTPQTKTGVVLHMLSCLAIDGRLGLTAIGTSAQHAAELYSATVKLLSESTDRTAATSGAGH